MGHRIHPGRNLAALGLALVAGLGIAGTVAASGAAAAPSLTVTACVQARGVLNLAVKAVLDLNPNVFPGGTVPAAGAVDPALLNQVLADPDLGEGGRGLVGAALAAFRSVAEACNVDATATPVPTTTPAPTTTAGPTTVVVPGPTVLVPVPRVREVQTG